MLILILFISTCLQYMIAFIVEKWCMELTHLISSIINLSFAETIFNIINTLKMLPGFTG